MFLERQKVGCRKKGRKIERKKLGGGTFFFLFHWGNQMRKDHLWELSWSPVFICRAYISLSLSFFVSKTDDQRCDWYSGRYYSRGCDQCSTTWWWRRRDQAAFFGRALVQDTDVLPVLRRDVVRDVQTGVEVWRLWPQLPQEMRYQNP